MIGNDFCDWVKYLRSSVPFLASQCDAAASVLPWRHMESSTLSIVIVIIITITITIIIIIVIVVCECAL